MSDNWPLVAPNDDGIRPAGPPDQCLYCRQKIGMPHARDCVVVQKLVRLRYVFEVDVLMPHSWERWDIERNRNESSWCHDNAIGDIERHASRELEDGTQTPCLCQQRRFRAEFVGVIDETPRRELRTAEQVKDDAAMRRLKESIT